MKTLINQFSLYLLQETSTSTRKNYLSDVGYFCQWLGQYLEKKGLASPSSAEIFLSLVTREISTNYTDFLKTQAFSRHTAARKIAGLKKFFSFAQKQGFIASDPSIWLVVTREKEPKSPKPTHQSILTKFSSYLEKQGVSSHSRESYIADMGQFIEWVSFQKQALSADAAGSNMVDKYSEIKQKLDYLDRFKKPDA